MRTALELKSTQISPGRRRRLPSGQGMLAELAERFAQFRRGHRRGTRVPEDLRAAALAALQEGVAPGELYRACGVSWGQVMAWKGRAPSGAKPRDAEKTTDVRVFSVLDEPPIGSRDPASSPGSDLELRLGRWSVSVRLADPESPGRG